MLEYGTCLEDEAGNQAKLFVNNISDKIMYFTIDEILNDIVIAYVMSAETICNESIEPFIPDPEYANEATLIKTNEKVYTYVTEMLEYGICLKEKSINKAKSFGSIISDQILDYTIDEMLDDILDDTIYTKNDLYSPY